MRLILIRHAETEENRLGIIQGQRPGQLSDLGQRQVAEVARALKDEPVDAIYSSDLQRCIDTAKPLKKLHKKVPFRLTPELREFSYGRLQGLPLGRIIKLVPKISFVLHFRLPGSESYAQVRSRLIRFLNRLYRAYPKGTVLLVTHGGPIRIIRLLLDKDVKPTTAQKVTNCSIWRLSMDKKLKDD